MENFDTVVFIGRFQPLHSGHVEVMKQGLISAKKNFVVLVGSVNGPRTYKNPFTFEQRRKVIEDVMLAQLGDFGPDVNVSVLPLRDSKYNNAEWMENVQKLVKSVGDENDSVAIIGYKKDESSQYLTWFPQWKYIPVDFNDDAAVVDATTVRNILFEGLNPGFFKGVLPNESYNFLEQFKTTPEYVRIRDEYEVIKAYRKSWEAAPYPPTFVCADCLVLCAGHVLLIQRGAQPGKGQWALPGGFINQFERIEDAAIRELREETKIKVPEPVLRGSIKKSAVFDHPDRSLRGRTISHVFRFDIDLDDSGKLPKVKGSDDAQAAKWIPLSEVNEDDVFEDHYRIMTSLVGTV